MKNHLLTLLMASALALPVTAHAAGLSVGTSGSTGASIGLGGGASAGASTSGSTSGSGFGTRTDLGQRQQIQSDSMMRPNGPLNDPDTVTSGTTNPNTTLGAGANTTTNTSTGIGLNNGIVTGTSAMANGNLRLDTARIRAVQTALKHKGYYSGSVDGRWGAATSRALQKFQTENRLAATGQADASTLNELDISSHLSGAGAASVNPAAR